MHAVLAPPAARVRPYEPRDAQAVGALLRDPGVALPLFGAVLRGGALQAHLRESWAEASPAGEARVAAWLAGSGELVGAARLEAGELSYFVACAHRGRGIGAALARAACAGEAAHRPLCATVLRDNLASQALLLALGFRFAGLRPACGVGAARQVGLHYVRRPGAAGLTPACAASRSRCG